MEKFIDRQQAGRMLTSSLKTYVEQPNTIVLALPRGGVPVAYEIATALSIPLDVLIVRKLGVPGHAELAMGAIASGGVVLLNESIIRQLKLQKSAIDAVIQSEQEELLRRERVYRGNRPFPDLLSKTIILVDDGIATGASIKAAISALRKHNPASIIVAVPVAAYETCQSMASLVDKLICPLQPINFCAVGLWYEDFSQTTDQEVIDLLEKSSSRASKP